MFVKSIQFVEQRDVPGRLLGSVEGQSARGGARLGHAALSLHQSDRSGQFSTRIGPADVIEFSQGE